MNNVDNNSAVRTVKDNADVTSSDDYTLPADAPKGLASTTSLDTLKQFEDLVNQITALSGVENPTAEQIEELKQKMKQLKELIANAYNTGSDIKITGDMFNLGKKLLGMADKVLTASPETSFEAFKEWQTAYKADTTIASDLQVIDNIAAQTLDILFAALVALGLITQTDLLENYNGILSNVQKCLTIINDLLALLNEGKVSSTPELKIPPDNLSGFPTDPADIDALVKALNESGVELDDDQVAQWGIQVYDEDGDLMDDDVPLGDAYKALYEKEQNKINDTVENYKKANPNATDEDIAKVRADAEKGSTSLANFVKQMIFNNEDDSDESIENSKSVISKLLKEFADKKVEINPTITTDTLLEAEPGLKALLDVFKGMPDPKPDNLINPLERITAAIDKAYAGSPPDVPALDRNNPADRLTAAARLNKDEAYVSDVQLLSGELQSKINTVNNQIKVANNDLQTITQLGGSGVDTLNKLSKAILQGFK